MSAAEQVLARRAEALQYAKAQLDAAERAVAEWRAIVAGLEQGLRVVA